MFKSTVQKHWVPPAIWWTGSNVRVGMNDVAKAPVGRPPAVLRLRWLVPIAVVATVLVAVSIVQTLHYSAAAKKLANLPMTGSSVGFFMPKKTTPVGFSLPALTPWNGRSTLALSDFLGQPLVINLWASTCTVCTIETPAMEATARKMAGLVEFVGIDSADQKGPAGAFVRKYHVTYPQVFDANADVASGYGVPGLPATFFVSASGKVVGENLGALTTNSLTHYLKVLFGVSPPG